MRSFDVGEVLSLGPLGGLGGLFGRGFCLAVGFFRTQESCAQDPRQGSKRDDSGFQLITLMTSLLTSYDPPAAWDLDRTLWMRLQGCRAVWLGHKSIVGSWANILDPTSSTLKNGT